MTDDTINTNTVDELSSTFLNDEWINNIITQTETDKTSPFMPENLMFLANLKASSRDRFESIRENLRSLGIILGRFDDAVKQQEKLIKAESGEDKKKAADIIVDLIGEAFYFHTDDNTVYADIISDNGHRETWAVKSDGFKRWVSHECYKKLKYAPTPDSIYTALNAIEARAINEGPELQVFLRAAQYDGKIYIDLCNDAWQAVEVTTEGYAVIDSPPVRFRRRRGMKPLPRPESGGTIDQLKSFLNVKDEDGFVLIVSWLLMVLSGHGPYPILVISGEQGTAKSTLMSFLRQLVDPNTAALRTLPRDVRDLFIAANNSFILAFDNLSYLSDWTSDALCRLSTGGGFATRTLHTDDEEILFDAMRPILMNGIESVGTRGDLVDRSIILRLEPIPEDKRQTAKRLQMQFNDACPYIFGAVINMLSHGLKRLPDVHLDRQPRMADFAIWATACETAFWEKGRFMQAFDANRADANDDVISGSPLATALCDFLNDQRTEWEGTAGDLQEELSKIVDEQVRRDKYQWPKTNKALSERLTRIAPALRRVGIQFDRRNGKDHKRLIKLYRVPQGLESAPPAPSALLVPGADTKDSPVKTPSAKGYKDTQPKFAQKHKPN